MASEGTKPEIKPAEIRHHDIRDEQVDPRRVIVCDPNRRAPIARRENCVTRARQHPLCGRAKSLFILDEQDGLDDGRRSRALTVFGVTRWAVQYQNGAGPCLQRDRMHARRPEPRTLVHTASCACLEFTEESIRL
jgi:hypothetical protein